MFKSQLQEYAQKAALPPPVYAFVKDGPPHDPRFRASVVVNGISYQGAAGFTNLKKAEHDAAKVALEALLRKGDSPGAPPAPVHQSGLCKNLLQEYAQKSGLALPVYRAIRAGEDHSPTFSATVEIDGVQYSGGAARTRKEAEIRAARIALLAIQTQPAATGGPQANAQALAATAYANSGNGRQGQSPVTRQGQPPVSLVQSGRQGQPSMHGNGRPGHAPMHSGNGRQGQQPMHSGNGRQGQPPIALVHSGSGRQGMPPMALVPSGSGRQGQPPMTLVHSGNGRQMQPPVTAMHSSYGGQGLRPMASLYSNDVRQGQLPIALVHPGEGRQMQHLLDFPHSGSARFGQPHYGGMSLTQSEIGRQLLPGYGAMPWSHPGDGRLEQPGFGGMSLQHCANGREGQPGQDPAALTYPSNWRQTNGRKRSRQDPRLAENYRGGKKLLHLPDVAQGYETCEAVYEPSSQESCLSQLEQSSPYGGEAFEKAEAMKRLVTEAWRIAEEVVSHQTFT